MRTSLPTVPLVLLLLVSSVGAQERTTPVEDPPRDEPALRGGRETTERWIEYVERRIPQLRAMGRLDAEIEEWLVLSTLQGDAPAPLEKAILTAVEMADRTGQTFGGENLPTILARRTIDELIEKHGKRHGAIAHAVGRMRFSVGDFEGAYDHFRYALEIGLERETGAIWLLRAAAAQTLRKLQAGEYQQAIDDLTYALELVEDMESVGAEYRILARLELSRAHRENNEHPVSQRIVEGLLEEYEGRVGTGVLARIHYEMGMVYHESGRIDAGVEWLERVLAEVGDEHPTFGDAAYTLTDAYTKVSPPRLEEAYALITGMLERERARGSDLTALHYRLGAIEYERGNLEASWKALEQAHDFGAQTLNLLIRVLAQLGTPEARAARAKYEDMLEVLQREQREAEDAAGPATEPRPEDQPPDDGADRER